MTEEVSSIVELPKGIVLGREILDLDGKPLPLATTINDVAEAMVMYGVPPESVQKLLPAVESMSDPNKRASEKTLTLRRALRNGLVTPDPSASMAQITDRLTMAFELAKPLAYEFNEKEKADLKDCVKRAYSSPLVVGSVALMLDGKL